MFLKWTCIYVYQVNIKYIILLKKTTQIFYSVNANAIPYYPLHITSIHSNFGNKCHKKRHERENSNIKWKTSNKARKKTGRHTQSHSLTLSQKKCTDETSTKICRTFCLCRMSSFLNKAYIHTHSQTDITCKYAMV